MIAVGNILFKRRNNFVLVLLEATYQKLRRRSGPLANPKVISAWNAEVDPYGRAPPAYPSGSAQMDGRCWW